MRKLRVGIIGCGQVAEHKHLRVLQTLPDIEIAAAADLDPVRLSRVADRYRVPLRFTDFRGILDHPDIDAVAVLTPPTTHAEIALAGLDADKHLLIEKPLALSLDDCDRLVERARRSSRKIMVGFHMRRHRLIERARDLLRQGVLGEIESMRTTWYSPVRYDENLPAWRHDRTTGGGALVEIAVHHFDLWRDLLGCEATEVFAAGRVEGRVDQTASVAARMETGAVVNGMFSERTAHDIDIEINGRDGRLRVACLRFDGLFQYPASGASGGIVTHARKVLNFLRELPRGLANRLPQGEYMLSYRRQWRHFADAVREDIPVGCTIEDGRRAVEIMLAATESASSGKPVTVGRSRRDIAPAVETLYRADNPK